MQMTLGQVLAEVLADARGQRALLLPRTSPRFVIPSRPAQAVARALREKAQTRSGRDRAQWLGLAGLVSARVGDIPGVANLVLPARDDGGVLLWLRQALGEDTHIGPIWLGPPRANQKPVVQVLNSEGRITGYLKVGFTTLTRRLVQEETAALRALAGKVGAQIVVPEVVDAGQVGNLELCLLRPLPAAAHADLEPSLLVRTVKDIFAVEAPNSLELTQAAAHPRLTEVADLAAAVLDATSGLARGGSHGDLHLGNVATDAHGRALVWDWERWSGGHLLGTDLLHHDFQQWVNREGTTPIVAAARLVQQAEDLLAPVGVDSNAAVMVAQEYLIRIAGRYCADNQEAAGSALGAVEQWAIPVLVNGR